ncbi:MAG: DUF3990 domain-containing protein [Lachnospiraceae bacterium]|nr:DUF3990 domain-containing protein [Lachnospiraceae bacterium]
MRDLYHGSTEDIMEIDFRKGKGYKDFGKGFYATAVKKHADSIALRSQIPRCKHTGHQICSDASIGVFDPRGSRQISVQARLLGSLLRGNKKALQAREERLRKRISGYKAKTFTAYRYNLEFDDRCISVPGNLKIKVFQMADKEWMRFILKNRDSEISVHNYDIVIGPTADENTVTIINSYKEELEDTDYADETLEALISELKPENLPKQYFFGTQAAIHLLRFKNVRREIVG